MIRLFVKIRKLVHQNRKLTSPALHLNSFCVHRFFLHLDLLGNWLARLHFAQYSLFYKTLRDANSSFGPTKNLNALLFPSFVSILSHQVNALFFIHSHEVNIFRQSVHILRIKFHFFIGISVLSLTLNVLNYPKLCVLTFFVSQSKSAAPASISSYLLLHF